MAHTARGSAIAETGVLAYLLTIPFGPVFPGAVRELMLGLVLVGVVWSHVEARGSGSIRPPYRFAWAAVAFGVSAAASVVWSVDPGYSLSASRYLPVALLLFFGLQHGAADAAAVRRLRIAIWCVLVVVSARAVIAE